MNLNLIDKLGPKTEKILNKINIFTVEDLLTYYPYKYNIIKFKNINEVDENLSYYIKSIVVSDVKVSYIKKNFNRMTFIARSSENDFNVGIINRAFLKKNITMSKNIILIRMSLI